MNIALKKTTIFLIPLLGLLGCGETPNSQLTEHFPIIRSGPLNMEFAFIPSGTFRMGSPKEEEGREENEHPHWVKLTQDYWVQTTEVTWRQWFEVMGVRRIDNECGSRVDFLSDQEPVVCVGRDEEVKVFLNKLNKKERNSNYIYRLPTEAEWEYATRAYTEDTYSLGGPLDSFAWYDFNAGRIYPVGKLKANFFGLYDVHGNVSELVSDGYEEQYPIADVYLQAVKDPKGPDKSFRSISRGGNRYSHPSRCRSAYRGSHKLDYRSTALGFRIVRDEK